MIINLDTGKTITRITIRMIWGVKNKESGYFAHFQTARHSGYINDTEIRYIDKTDPSNRTRRKNFWNFKTSRSLMTLTHTISGYFCIFNFYESLKYLGKMLIFLLFQLVYSATYIFCDGIGNSHIIFILLHLFTATHGIMKSLSVDILKWFLILSLNCLFLSFLFIYSNYLGHCSFSI